jgi:phosphohistidine phosphatase SixA
MRHGEKPADPKNPDLSSAGLHRAEELAAYIPTTFGALDLLFASALSKHSARPYETIKPLAKKLGLAIDASYADQDYGALAAELLGDQRYAGKRIAVAWHHGNIPSLAQALGAARGDYPDPWNPAIFHLILKFEWRQGAPPLVTQVTEPF